MTTAAAWLEPHLANAPESLRKRMLDALAPAEDVPQALADAALNCLRAALAKPDDALDLLAADALLTHAFAAAAEHGDEAVARFAESLDASRFQTLIRQQP